MLFVTFFFLTLTKLTAYNIQGVKCNVRIHIEGALSHFLLQFVDKHVNFPIENVYKLFEDLEVKRWCNNFSTFLPPIC